MREAMFNGFFGGTVGSFLAVSGGLIFIPLWIRTGIDRSIVINSTAPLIFFGSSVSFLISLLLGFYSSFLQVLLFFIVGFIGSYHIKSNKWWKYRLCSFSLRKIQNQNNTLCNSHLHHDSIPYCFFDCSTLEISNELLWISTVQNALLMFFHSYSKYCW